MSHLEAIIEGVWEPTTERLQSCYDELGRISDMISDLEKLRQIEDENMILEKEPVDLLELSQAVQCAFEQELDKKQLTCKVSGEAAVVFGDQKRLHQVIFNLVSNAIKYSTEGGCINITVRNETDTAMLIIEDQGIGISEKDLPLIFERFYRTDRSRNRKMSDGTLWEGQIALYFRWTCLPDCAVPELDADYRRNKSRLS